MANSRPYVSVVVAGRNDDYGKNFLSRFQMFLENQFFLWEKSGLNAELIVVEWNPPADKPRLYDVLRLPKKLTQGSMRIIEVPAEIHKKFPAEKKQEFFEYIAKNVGARRARGEYVLATNSDLLYSDALMAFFASRGMRPNAFYRVNRYDLFAESVPLQASSAERLKFAEMHYRYVHNNYGPMVVRGERPWDPRIVRRLLTYARNRIRYFPFPPPYMNAAGDFFLMHRTQWERFGGYPEVPPFAYPDALCFIALAEGLQQIILPYPIYHQDHERGGPETGRPLSDFERNRERYMLMLKEQKQWPPKNEKWGLGDEMLPEYSVF